MGEAMNKCIFLDIDGVLNVEVFINAFWAICKQMELNRPDAAHLRKAVMRDDYGNLFCPTAVNHLAWVIEVTGANIVISSTWRSSGLDEMKAMWKFRKLPGEVIDVTPHIRRNDDLDFKERAERGHEIQHWLDNHPEVESYVIFDDNDDMLKSQEDHFIKTDEKYGITHNDALKAIEILNK